MSQSANFEIAPRAGFTLCCARWLRLTRRVTDRMLAVVPVLIIAVSPGNSAQELRCKLGSRRCWESSFGVRLLGRSVLGAALSVLLTACDGGSTLLVPPDAPHETPATPQRQDDDDHAGGVRPGGTDGPVMAPPTSGVDGPMLPPEATPGSGNPNSDPPAVDPTPDPEGPPGDAPDDSSDDPDDPAPPDDSSPDDPPPNDPGPNDPGPNDPGPNDPGPGDPGPDDPGPGDPGEPDDPDPVPDPSEPEPVDDDPSTPVDPTEPSDGNPPDSNPPDVDPPSTDPPVTNPPDNNPPSTDPGNGNGAGDGDVIGPLSPDIPGGLPSFHIAVIGSSTAGGVGASSGDSAWVNLLEASLSSRAMTPVTTTNLAVGGYTADDLAPGSGMPGSIDDAIREKPDLILIALAGSNDLDGIITTEFFVSQLVTLRDTAKAAGIPTFFMGTLPKNFTEPNRQLLIDFDRAMASEFGACWIPGTTKRYAPCYIDVFDSLADSAHGLALQYDSGDGQHPNDAGHAVLFRAVDDIVEPYVCTKTSCR
ncbi:MAG TPA: GDSL-type esterase/lipase family protein [Polyangiaceae bacterium]|nr:GDSL-type esterase/lipase family protein [Polyangiaceae bacterium]